MDNLMFMKILIVAVSLGVFGISHIENILMHRRYAKEVDAKEKKKEKTFKARAL